MLPLRIRIVKSSPWTLLVNFWINNRCEKTGVACTL
jgi:hypothetical protein